MHASPWVAMSAMQ
jgi:MgsA AAA+ ATPase C terminal